MASVEFVSLPAELPTDRMFGAVCTGSLSASSPLATPSGAPSEMSAPTFEEGGGPALHPDTSKVQCLPWDTSKAFPVLPSDFLCHHDS